MQNDHPYLRSIINAFVSGLLATLGVYFSRPPVTIPPGTIAPAPPAPIIIQPAPQSPPMPDPPLAKPEGKADAPAALVRIQFGSAGCTATVIGPRREDGRWNVMTAAHCVKRVGDRGSARFKDGRVCGIQVTSLNTTSDVAWCVTETNSEVYPFANLAHASPAVGEKVWHAGYGVDAPGNREDGIVEAGPDSSGQLRFRLSVSSGDSGGGICLNEKNEVLSPVCCTTAKGRVAQVWGCSPEAAARARPTSMAMDGWEPLEIPERMPVMP
jgi:hypothetical protein